MIVLVVLSLISASCSLPTMYNFHAWKQEHAKVYTPAEEMVRLAVWMDNAKYVDQYNARADTTMTLKLNTYSDLTHEEFRNMLTGSMNDTKEYYSSMLDQASTFIEPANIEIPSSVDWRTKGAVTPIKNQGQCGSCYSFATTGGIEGQWFRKTGALVSLSEQQIVDCSGRYGNQGCNGGMMNNGFRYVRDNRGIDTERAYPYEGVQGSCRFRSAYIGAKITGFSSIPQGSESALASAVASVGPVPVAIDASHRSLQFYTGGVYYEPQCSSYNLDHAVMAVGYGTLGSKQYWIIKNSWGVGWGLDGYFLLARNRGNACGVATMASYPLV